MTASNDPLASDRSVLKASAAHERTLLQPADHSAFFTALDRPPPPSARLKAAFDRRQMTVSSLKP